MSRSLLNRHLRAEAQRADEVAATGVALLDAFRADPTPARLQVTQEVLYVALRQLQERLITMADPMRRDRRRARFARRVRELPGRQRVIGWAGQAYRDYEAFVRLQRDILRQIGDACAWLLLDSDPHRILPLFDHRRVHTLATGLGAAGPAQIALELHRSGRFFALETDLTRCLGAGDLIVVRADARTPRPLIVEVKTHGDEPARRALNGRGAGSDLDRGVSAGKPVIGIECIVPVSENAEDLALHADFERVVSARVVETARICDALERPAGGRRGRQEAELRERAERVLHYSTRAREIVPQQGRTTWVTARRVVERALQSERAIDIAEPGVLMLGMRQHEGADNRSALDDLLLLAQAYGVHTPVARLYSSEHLTRHALLSPLVPPIALWPMPAATRAALLTGDVLYACAVETGLWHRVFEDAGLHLIESPGGWIVERGAARAYVSRQEAAKLRYGVALAGYSPRDVTQRLAAAL